jgi:lambda repressor-like predicted transcriptional regulator
MLHELHSASTLAESSNTGKTCQSLSAADSNLRPPLLPQLAWRCPGVERVIERAMRIEPIEISR